MNAFKTNLDPIASAAARQAISEVRLAISALGGGLAGLDARLERLEAATGDQPAPAATAATAAPAAPALATPAATAASDGAAGASKPRRRKKVGA